MRVPGLASAGIGPAVGENGLAVVVFVTQQRRRTPGARLPYLAVLGISMSSLVVRFQPAAQIDPPPDQMSGSSDRRRGDDEQGAVSALGHCEMTLL